MATEATIIKPSPLSARRPALLAKLVRTVRQRKLFVPGHHLLVAVSGGPDSVALLSLLYRLARPWRLKLTVVHCNFGLRGSESDDDESFVSNFCRERGLTLFTHRPVLIKRRRSSFQEMARNARYDFMKQLAHEIGADRVAMGHTANDQAETVLMWLLRGAGVKGLAGMTYDRKDGIIRPLLAATREEVVAYLTHEGLTYRRDSSNDKPLYHRNRIRNELLPVITRLVPGAVRILQRQADVICEDEQYLEHMTDELVRTVVIQDGRGVQRVDQGGFIELPVALQRRLVRAILRGYNEEKRASSLHTVESVRRLILKGRSGERLSMKRVLVTLDQRAVRFSPVAKADHSRPIDSDEEWEEKLEVLVPSRVVWGRTNQQFHVQLMTRRTVDELCLSPSRGLAIFDADRFSSELIIRAWRFGDRFFPLGMAGRSKKLQDFFTDRKIVRHERGRIPLLVAPEGILWVIGMHQDERFVIHSGTIRCLVVSVHDRMSKKG